jgi:hypothetical protein
LGEIRSMVGMRRPGGSIVGGSSTRRFRRPQGPTVTTTTPSVTTTTTNDNELRPQLPSLTGLNSPGGLPDNGPVTPPVRRLSDPAIRPIETLSSASSSTSSMLSGSQTERKHRGRRHSSMMGQPTNVLPSDRAVSLNPFAEVDAKEESTPIIGHSLAMEQLEDKDLPSIDFSKSLWAKLQQWRYDKFARELELKAQAQMLDDMKKHHSELDATFEAVQQQMTRLRARKDAFDEKRLDVSLNTELSLRLQQGLVEIEDAPVVNDMGDSQLIDRSIVLQLNRLIVDQVIGCFPIFLSSGTDFILLIL